MWENATFLQPVTINWWVEAIKWVIYGWKLRLLVSLSPLLHGLFLACSSGDLRLQGMKKEPVKNLRCLSFSDVAFLQCLNTATTLGQDNTSAKIISLIPTNESFLSPPIQFTLLHMLVVLIFSVSIPSIFPVFKTNRQRVPFHTPRVFFPQLHSSMAYWLAEQGHQAPDELR